MHLLDSLTYLIIRSFGLFVSCFSYSFIHRMGKILGTCAYYCHHSFRKKALTNLAIAFGKTKNEQERKRIAQLSFQNLMITCLEFFRFPRSKGNLSEIVSLEDSHEIEKILNQKKGIIFLSAHQSNWEISFLALTERFRGIAIGRPIKNRRVYKWILSIREMNGGKIVMPKNAIHAGLRALKKGEFLGIVGDQAYPQSPYSYPLFGTRAWTASTPALMAYKTGCPLVAGTTVRKNGRYIVQGSPPIWPNQDQPSKDEVTKMMDEAMKHLEASIAQYPEQWMWIHDRWKQQGIDHVKREYRYGFILITLPPDPTPFLKILPLLRQIYPRSFLTFFVPMGTSIPLSDCDVMEYENENDLFVRDWRFQLLLDFYDSRKLRGHFLKLGVFKALYLKNMAKKLSLEETIKQKLVKTECLKTVFL